MPKKVPSTPRGKKETGFRWLGFPVRGAEPFTFRRHILVLAVLTIAMKFVVTLITTNVFHSIFDLYDITYYLKYALQIYGGQIPYVQFSFDYPPGVFVSVLIPLVLVVLTKGYPALLAGDVLAYVLFHEALMILFDLGSTILVYLIGLSLYDEKRGFTAGILYATAFSSAYFVMTKYDAYPTFFLLLAVALFITGRQGAGYIASAWGFLVKWFPVLAIPFFAISDAKAGLDRNAILRRLALPFVLILLFSLPFLLLNPQGFIGTYTGRAGYAVLTHSFVFYLDFLVKTLGGTAVFGKIALFLTAVSEILLLVWYYRQPRKDPIALIVSIFIAVALFILTNPLASPQYLMWITPFMALFLAGSPWDILLYYAIQAWGYLEFPLLFRGIYDNVSGYGAGESGFPTAAFLFFSVKFILLFLAIVWILRRTALLRGAGGPEPPGPVRPSRTRRRT